MSKIIQANNTHTHKKATLARRALADACDSDHTDLDDYHVCRADNGMWGWISLPDWEAICGIPAAEQEFGPVAGAEPEPVAEEGAEEGWPVVAHASQEVIDAFGMGPLVDAGLVVAHAGGVDLVTGDEGEYQPEPTVEGAAADEQPAADDEAPPVDLAGGDVHVMFGPAMLPHAAKALALQLAKRYGQPIVLVNAAHEVVEAVDPRGQKIAAEKAAKARTTRTPFGAAVAEDGKPVRPVINSGAHQSCSKLLDKIDDCEFDLESLLCLVGTPGFKGGYTYGNIVARYLTGCIGYARAHTANDDVPGIDVTAAAAD